MREVTCIYCGKRFKVTEWDTVYDCPECGITMLLGKKYEKKENHSKKVFRKKAKRTRRTRK